LFQNRGGGQGEASVNGKLSRWEERPKSGKNRRNKSFVQIGAVDGRLQTLRLVCRMNDDQSMEFNNEYLALDQFSFRKPFAPSLIGFSAIRLFPRAPIV
jgi:hypothetical protein